MLAKLSQTTDDAEARGIIKDALPPLLRALMKESELDELIDRVRKLPVPDKKLWVTTDDFRAAIQIFFLVFLCTLPVALPFAFITNVFLALRVSNGVALLLLFIAGLRLAKYAGLKPGATALIYVLIGVLLVSLTMALGG